MVGDRTPLQYALHAADNLLPPSPKEGDWEVESGNWLGEHIFKPLVNGSGVLNIAENFTSKPIELTSEKPTNKLEWSVQNLASAAGAFVPYLIAAELMHGAGRGLARELGATRGFGRLLASEGTAQIAGAGLYDALKHPNAEKGETRAGQSTGSMAGFATFMGGNALFGNLVREVPNPVLRFALNASSKILVGGAGGIASYETSNRVSNRLGMHNQMNDEGLGAAMTQGAFLNVAIPSAHVGINWLKQNIGGTVPVGHHFRAVTDPQARSLVRENFLTDVKLVSDDVPQSSALIGENKLSLRKSDDPASQLQELKHISLAREMEPAYARIATLAATDRTQAQTQFFDLRAHAESKAREFENSFRIRTSTQPRRIMAVDTETIGNELAGNGRTYRENWQTEWEGLLADPTFRPRVEYHGDQPEGTPTEPAPAQPPAIEKAVPVPASPPPVEAPPAPAKSSPAPVEPAPPEHPQAVPEKPATTDGAETREILPPPPVEANSPTVGTIPAEIKVTQEVKPATVVSPAADQHSPPKDNPANTKDTPSELIARGDLKPFGAMLTDKGVNFSLPTDAATRVELLLWDKATDKDPSAVLPMFRTERFPLLHEGAVFHRFVEGAKEGTLYTYRIQGEWNPQQGLRINQNNEISDPFARAVVSEVDESKALPYDNSNPNDPDRHLRPNLIPNIGEMAKSVVVKSDSFDWQDDKHLMTPLDDSVFYEMHLRGFTAAQKELGSLAGTYRGLIANVPYLKQLGITSVELMPIFKFNNSAWPHTDPVTGERLHDSWGYNPLFPFAPEGRYAADGVLGQQVNEFKEMVRELHKNGIEVILDVVYNHSGEGNQYGPSINLKGIDNKVHYLLNRQHLQYYIDNTGCGNTLNTNSPATMELILDSLHYWATEMHVDGFRFDLATIFKYREDGSEHESTPIMRAIEKDPILSQLKIIAEPWGPKQYYVGRFSTTLWGEWNDKFRDTVRDFWIGNYNRAGAMGDVLVGSPHTYKPTLGRYTVNATNHHDGFTLEDWLSYNRKHNESNGEDNRDGSDNNRSWNHGFEGPIKVNLTGSLNRALDKLTPIAQIDRASVWWAPKTELEQVLSMNRAPGTPAEPPVVDGVEKAELPQVTEPKSDGNAFVVPMRTDPGASIEGYLLVEHSQSLPADATDAILAAAREGAFTLQKANAIKSLDHRDEIQALRDRQAKNMITTVMLSRGVPQFLYGDEVGRTADGNNNAWCVERLNEMDPDLLTLNADRRRFFEEMIDIRKSFRLGRATKFTWHGVEPNKPDWAGSARTIAREVDATEHGGRRIYHAFNAHTDPVTFKLPPGRWRRLIDTNLTGGQDILRPNDSMKFEEGLSYTVQPRSAILFEADDKPAPPPPVWRQLDLPFTQEPAQHTPEVTK